jgi:hypothetical protein
MIGFKDLKSIIVRNSRTVDDKNKSSDINAKFNFTINVDRLEKALSSKSDLHVVAFSKNIVSRVPDISELQLISEYVHKKEEINTIFDGKTQIATFMFYCDMNGTLHIGEKDNTYTSKEICDAINTDEEPDKEIAMILAESFPMYRAMVVRRFDNRKDKFVYSIYFRSSYSMITYINSLKEEGKFNSADNKDTVEEIPETTSEE